MGKMRRLLAAVLVASMLFGTNGVSYAAETIADGASQETTVEETTEAVTEDTESAAPAESDPSETVDAVTQTGAEDSSQDDSEAVEEAADTESDADDKEAAADNETDASETEKANDEAAVPETGDAGNAAETPEVGSSTEVAEEVPAEVTFSAGKLEFNGDDYGKDYSVTLTYDADAEIPADAQLQVTEIEKDKDLEKYEAYLKEANAAVENSVTDARFFDIKIMVGDEEIQPKSAVRVNISYKEAIEVEEKAEVQAVHFDEEKDEPVPVEIETNNDDKVDEVEFEAETFSVYAVLYTVDFNYTDHAFSIPGGSSIRLSELAQKLGFYAESETKEFSVQDVAKVTFTNPELVKVEKQADGDWMLTSLKAFSTKETLTIDMANGDQFVVDVTDAQDALSVDVNLYKYGDAETMRFPNNFSDDNIYAFVWLDDGSDKKIKNLDDSTPWAVVNLNDANNNIEGSNSPYNFTVSSFSTNKWYNDNSKPYSNFTDEQKNNLKVRIIHTNSEPSLGQLKDMEESSLEQLMNGGFDGYDMSSHPSGYLGSDKYEVNFIQGNTKEIDVALKFNPEDDKGPIESGKYYVLLDATSSDGNNHYYYVVEATTDGTKVKELFKIEGKWSGGQPFSNNWKDIKISVITPKQGQTIETGGVEPNASTYDKCPYSIGEYLYTTKRDSETDDDAHIQHEEFVVELKKANFESAIGPYDVLGDGAEFGVVANKYVQGDDSETNFAANIYENPSSIQLKVGEKGAAGDNIAPFYVGRIDAGKLRLGQETQVDCDVYVNKNQTDLVQKDNSDSFEVTKYPMSEADINSTVNGYIKKLKDSSSDYAKKVTITPTYPTTDNQHRDLDTSSLPDNITIYVNAENMDLGKGGGTIRKLPGQTIVFNIPGENVLIKDFDVQLVNEDGTDGDKINSNTSANGGDAATNQKIEEAILNHIVFNAYEASNVEVQSGPSGLFLIPKGNVKQDSGSGTGWIATANTFNQNGGEWHFFRTQRKYKSKGDFSLAGQKRIMDGETPKDYSDFASMTFTFELYQCDEHGVIEDGAEALESVKASSTEGSYGQFNFSKLKYTQADFIDVSADDDGKKTKTFYYVIKEVVPEGGKVDSVEYNADPVYIKVEATDTPGAEGTEGTITFKIYTSSGAEEDEEWQWTEVQKKTGVEDAVYEIGNFDNTYEKGKLIVKKTIVGARLTNDKTFKFTVVDKDGKYYYLEGTETKTSTDAKYVEVTVLALGLTAESKVLNVPLGNYTVTEYTGTDNAEIKIAEYSVKSVSDPVTAVVNAASATTPVTATITNTYVKDGKATLQVKKALGEGDTWPDGKSAVFTLAAVNGAPMPTAAGGNTVTLTAEGIGSFGAITYPLSSANTTYEYTISEELTGWPAGWTKSGDIKVRVAVGADTGSGELSTAVTYSTDGGETYGNEAKFYTITNTYVVTGTATIKVEKAVSGTRWPNGGEVSFTIARQAGEANAEAPLPDPQTTEVQTEAGEKSFGAIALGNKDIGKIYYYEITENATGFNAGWSVTPEKIIVKMDVGQPDDQAHLNPTVTYSINGGKTYGRTRSFYTITNKYESSGEINLEVNKKMVGRPISSSVDKDKGRFAFDLYIYDPTVRGTGDGESPLTNYRYVGTVNCDSTGIAKFLAEDAQFKNDLTFNQNDIESWSIDGTGTGKKKFKVLEVIPDDATENEDGIFSKDGYTYDSSIKSITVNLKDYGNGHIDAEVVKEESDELEFTNKYAAEGEIVLHAQKKLIGARKLEEGQFTFELIEVIEKDDSEVENVIDTKKNDAKGTVTFDPIKYTQDVIYEKDADGVYSGSGEKEFTYKIREVIPKGAVDNGDGTYFFEGYTYDGNVYTIKVTATDNGDGTITAVDAADKATDGQKPTEEKYVFVNAYDAVGGLKLNAEKTYKNGTLRGGEFTFELRDADGKVLQSRKNDAAGHVYFEPLDYELEDAAKSPFTYTVREVPGSRTDVKYDATVYTVTVSLEDNGDGTLKVTKKIDNGGALKFVNEQLNVETSVTIEGVKVLEGKTLKNDQFKFVLADADGKWVDTATNDADGNFTFKPITYKLSDLNGEKAKVFTYGVSEVKGSDSGITYDEKVYTVKVTVTDNGDGTMTAKADLAKKDIKFVNKAAEKKTKKKDNTKTGDEAPLGVLFGGLGIGAAGLAVLLEDRKRRNRNK